MKHLFVIFIFCVNMFFAVSSVSAHAYIRSSFPAQNQRVETPPTEIVVTFTEKIDTNVTVVTLKDEAGNIIPTKQRGEDDIRIILTPLQPLKKGVYKVSFNALSLDTHFSDGSYEFGVGTDVQLSKPDDTIKFGPDTDSEAPSSNNDEAKHTPVPKHDSALNRKQDKSSKTNKSVRQPLEKTTPKERKAELQKGLQTVIKNQNGKNRRKTNSSGRKEYAQNRNREKT